MTPALRFLRHGDGGLALFNGAQEGEPVLIEDVNPNYWPAFPWKELAP